MPVDLFFCSLAEERGSRAAGVVLSGSGRDGSLGLRAIREKGGITAAQDPEDADYSEMPRNAISEGRVEMVLPADELAAEVLRVIGEDGLERVESKALPDEAESALDRIVARVGSESGHDLRRFRRSTLLRRLDRRMRFGQVASIEEYAQRIEDDEAERQALFQDLLISVSHFFRDPEAFDATGGGRRKDV
jgi:two-component system CheB/CheR fusion protein